MQRIIDFIVNNLHTKGCPSNYGLTDIDEKCYHNCYRCDISLDCWRYAVNKFVDESLV